VAALLALHLGARSQVQARVWRSPATIGLAAAANYPEGLAAHRMRARQAALRGDASTAALELRGALALGFDRFMDVRGDPAFAAVHGAPEFEVVMREIAADWIATSRARADPTHYDLYWRAEAHLVRGEFDEAEAAFQEALSLGGGFDQGIHAELAALREHRNRLDAEAPANSSPAP
jgi:tetratricopeptide (TPR) repeat protein